MKRGIWKSWAIILPFLTLIGACSGASEQPEGALLQEAPGTGAAPITDWADFIGIPGEEAEAHLDRIRLRRKIGQNVPLNEEELVSYLNLVFEKDNEFQRGIEALNDANIDLFSALRVRVAIPGLDGQAALEQKYVATTDLAKALRRRLLDGANILGLVLQPADLQVLLVDDDFREIRDDFVRPMTLRLFGTEFLQTFDTQKQLIAELLAAVTFSVDGNFLSFYAFADIPPDAGRSVAPIGGPVAGPRERGAFRVLNAEDNSYFYINWGGDNWNNPPGVPRDDRYYDPDHNGSPPWRWGRP